MFGCHRFWSSPSLSSFHPMFQQAANTDTLPGLVWVQDSTLATSRLQMDPYVQSHPLTITKPPNQCLLSWVLNRFRETWEVYFALARNTYFVSNNVFYSILVCGWHRFPYTNQLWSGFFLLLLIVAKNKILQKLGDCTLVPYLHGYSLLSLLMYLLWISQ